MSHSKPVYSITYHRSEKLVDLIWLAGTQSMTDQDFRDALSVFAECAIQHRARCLIVDMREFRHHPSSEVLEFRDEVIGVGIRPERSAPGAVAFPATLVPIPEH